MLVPTLVLLHSFSGTLISYIMTISNKKTPIFWKISLFFLFYFISNDFNHIEERKPTSSHHQDQEKEITTPKYRKHHKRGKKKHWIPDLTMHCVFFHGHTVTKGWHFVCCFLQQKHCKTPPEIRRACLMANTSTTLDSLRPTIRPCPRKSEE